MLVFFLVTLLACSGTEPVSPPPEPPPQEKPTSTTQPPPKPDPTPQTNPDPVAEPEPQKEPESVATIEPEPNKTPEPKPQKEPQKEPQNEPQNEPQKEPEPEPEAEPVVEPEPDPEPVTAQRYSVGPGKSQLYVQVFKDPSTVASGASHDHVIVAQGWSGAVVWHPTDPRQCSIQITVPVARLNVDPPGMRRAVGYDVELTRNQRDSVKKNMLATGQLNGSVFPEIEYRSRSCDKSSGAVKVTGDLTIRGKRKSITTTLNVNLDGGFSARGTFKARATDFGFEPYTALFGALKNQNQMKFTVSLKAP